jgi:plastocyanin
MIRRLASIAALLSLASFALVVAPVALVAAPVALAGDPCYHGFESPTRMDEATADIKAMPCAFAPTVARIPVGGTVTFYNGESFSHLVTGANQEWGSRDTELRPGQEVSYTFAAAGIYPYACALHRGMSGVIIVGGETASAAGAGSARTTTVAGAADTRAPRAESALAPVVAGAAIAIVAGAAVIARRRRPVAIQ